ncbi:hypothetical protein E2C01_012463 [Portunus trituberculatus]|uniref:Uncharacterized protein n=1 Tax=Portunus trituberculatus TaxID=210409 RepID=A0A5B7DEA3_PORTR|nr:hypothetical protein [Portunus trituberculatus]
MLGLTWQVASPDLLRATQEMVPASLSAAHTCATLAGRGGVAHLRIGAAGGTGLKAHQLALLHLGVGRPPHKLGLQILAAVITGVICCWRGNLLLFPVGVILHPLRADDLTLGGVHDHLPAGYHGKLSRGNSAARIVFSQHCVVAIVGCVHLFDHERDLAGRLRHQIKLSKQQHQHSRLLSQPSLAQQGNTYPRGRIAIDFDGEGGIASICDLSGARLLEELWSLGWTLDGPLFLHHLACHADALLHLVFGAIDKFRPLAGPGDCWFGVASDPSFEEGIATLGKPSILEDLREHGW